MSKKPSETPNPFPTSTRPCVCNSGKPTKDCCGPDMQPSWGESEAMKNIKSKPGIDSSYGSYVAQTAKHYLKQIFPNDASNIQIVTANIDDREYRSSAIVTKDDGHFSRELFKGTRNHETPEASVEALLYAISQKLNPSLSRQQFDEELRVAWQATLANKAKATVIEE